MDYHYYIFDYDGCISPTLSLWLKHYRLAFQHFGYPKITDRQITSIFGDWSGPSKLAGVDDRVFYKYIKPNLEADYIQLQPYPEVTSALTSLKDNGAVIALLSSNLRQLVDAALENQGISQVFSMVITGDDIDHHKPHPQGIDKICRELHFDKTNTVMIGDSDKDIFAAHNAGIESVLFFPDEHHQYYPKEALLQANPTHVISSFRQLI